MSKQSEQSTNTTPDGGANNQPTVNKRLDKIIETFTQQMEYSCDLFINKEIDDETYSDGVEEDKDSTKQALTSLMRELAEEAMPEPGTNLTSYEAQMFIISTEEYRQNLLKAL